MAKSKSNEYVLGFKHGVNWLLQYSGIEDLDPDWEEEDFKDTMKETIKSLRAGR